MSRPEITESKHEEWKVSGISNTFPTYRNTPFITIQSWMQGKRQDDGAEGLWRIYDTLYDFSDFVDRHPGGGFWLNETKGTDITESFESHHISTLPETMLGKYKVRQASQPRNYTLTFEENGFYKTLKSRVREVYMTLDKSPRQRTDRLHMSLLISTVVSCLLSAYTGWIVLQLAAGIFLCWLTIAAHNYFHRKDNWQMYTFNLSLMNFSTWRVSHALSHHAYPNSMHDLEMSLFEPFLCWIPNPYILSKFRRVISVVLQPIVYLVLFPFQLLPRVYYSICYRNCMYWHDVIGFLLPVLMLAVSDARFGTVIQQWMFIVAIGSFFFGLIGLNAAHHDPEIHHDGDANRTDRDWGLFQLDSIVDRGDTKGSQFLVLTSFGEHSLHHLFPTLDHSLLPLLDPVFLKTLKEFGVDMRYCSHLGHIIGQNKQLLRTEPNLKAPGSKKIS